MRDLIHPKSETHAGVSLASVELYDPGPPLSLETVEIRTPIVREKVVPGLPGHFVPLNRLCIQEFDQLAFEVVGRVAGPLCAPEAIGLEADRVHVLCWPAFIPRISHAISEGPNEVVVIRQHFIAGR